MSAPTLDPLEWDRDTGPIGVESVAPPDPYIGRLLTDRYRVERKLGKGATSTVYEATHATLGRQVAVKIMNATLARLPGVGDLIFREARAVAALGHPHIIEAIDAGFTGDSKPFVVLEM